MTDPSVATTGTGSRVRVGSLDGLRGVAVLAVTWCHLSVHLGLTSFPPGGFIGVLVFFVLSGYLITGIVWRGADLPGGYLEFLRRRVTRLGPAIAGMCLTYVVLMPLIGGRELTDTIRYAAIALFQGTGFWYSSEASQVPSEFAPTWSLTVEWAFYLVWPLCLLALRARTADVVVVARTTLAAAVGLVGLGQVLSDRQFYILPVVNLAVMLAGAALALHAAHRRARGQTGPHGDPGLAVLALIAIVVLSVIPGFPLGPAYRYAVLPAVTVFSVMVIASATQPHSPVGRVLASRPLTAVGLRAYSLYLWQIGVFWLVWRWLGLERPWVTAVVALGALALVATASFRWLERPVLAHR